MLKNSITTQMEQAEKETLASPAQNTPRTFSQHLRGAFACIGKYLWRQRPFMLSLLTALVGGQILFSTMMLSLASTIIDLGLDPSRAQLIAALLLTIGAALPGAGSGRRKLAAIVGASIIFASDYLYPFIQQELQPLRDPGGLLEPLSTTALLSTSGIMLALALLCAFMGSAIGLHLSQILLDPFYQLLVTITHFISRPRTPDRQVAHIDLATGSRSRPLHVLGSWATMGIMVLLLVLAGNSGDLFIFSPDLGLHSLPALPRLPGTSATPGATPVPAVSKIIKDSLTSAALGGLKKSFSIYLPPSYNTPDAQAKHYPVLYFLHGSPGSSTDGFTGAKLGQSADTLIAMGKIPELIIVLPDGNGRAGSTSEWSNSFDGKQNIENYLVNDLVRYVDQHYRTLSDARNRAISGISMGGFGAMNIAIQHPDVFGIAIPLGGYYHAEGAIWGNNAAYMRLNSPAETILTARQAWHLRIFLGAANKDQPYFTYTKQFAQELDQLHIPYTFDLENGYHAWTVWQVQMYKALLWITWTT